MENTAVMSGFEGLDKTLGGFRGGKLNVIAGLPGMGKSALAVSIASNVAGKGIPVVVFSLEMSKKEISDRLLKSGAVNLPIVIDDSIYTDPITMHSSLMEFFGKPETKPGLVVIDYLQLMCMPGFEGKPRTEEIAAKVRKLKLLATEFNVPIIVLSQQSRAAIGREEHVPKLDDLRISDPILDQYVDSVVFILRPSWYEERPHPIIEDAQLIVAKNRFGNSDVKVDVKWYRDKVMFADQ